MEQYGPKLLELAVCKGMSSEFNFHPRVTSINPTLHEKRFELFSLL